MDRREFDNISQKLLDIMNLMDIAKFKEIVNKYEEDPLFSMDKILLDVKVNNQPLKYSYGYKEGNISDDSDEPSADEKSESNPDIDELNWATLSEKNV